MTRYGVGRWARGLAGVLLGSSLLLGGCKTQATTPSTTPVQPTPEPATTPEPDPVAEAPARQYPDPPPPTAPKPVNFPGVETFKLANGLTVYVVENHEVPLVSIQLVIRAGEMDAELVADTTAQMLGEGTKTRSKAKVDEAIEFVGGWLGSGSDLHATYVFSRVLKKDLKLGLTLVADEVTAPLFPAEALVKLKDQIKTGINFSMSDPGTLAARLFNNVAYPDKHPYGLLLPTPEQVDAMTLADITKFHSTYYKANNAFLVLAGDITASEAKPVVKRALSRWDSAKGAALPPNPLNAFKAYDLPKELTVHIVDRPDSAQTEILLGNLALSRSHADWPAIRVANAILGDDASGRLFMDIREEKGIAYGISAALDETQAPGSFYITTRTRTATTGEMLAAIFGHIKQIRDQPPTEAEVKTAVNKIIGGFPLEIETPNAIAEKMRDALIFELPTDYWARYRDDIASVTPESVHAAARKYIHPIPHVVVVGNGAEIEKQLRTVLPKANLVHYDSELKKK